MPGRPDLEEARAMDDAWLAQLYERYGFLASPAHPRTLALPLQDAAAQLR